jgi:hypothetical protein
MRLDTVKLPANGEDLRGKPREDASAEGCGGEPQTDYPFVFLLNFEVGGNANATECDAEGEEGKLAEVGGFSIKFIGEIGGFILRLGNECRLAGRAGDLLGEFGGIGAEFLGALGAIEYGFHGVDFNGLDGVCSIQF